jgi:hypothetical protein
MVYPKSNLPTAAQPWGRYVEKDITTLQTTVATERVNNAARDAQNSLNIKRIDESLTTVKQVATQTADLIASTGITANKVDDLETNVYYPGTVNINGGNIQAGTITGNKINANYVYAGNISANQITSGSISGDRITGGTITGTTVQTSGGSSSVSLNAASNALSIKYNNATIANLTAGYDSVYGTGMTLNYGATAGDTSGTNLFMVSNAAALSSGNGFLVVEPTSATLNANNIYINGSMQADDISSSGNIDANNITAGTKVYGSTVQGASVTSTGNMYAAGTMSCGSDMATSGSLTRTALNGGGTTGASFTNSGALVRTSSSERYKQDIEDADYSYEDILNLKPKSFRLKEEVLEDENARRYAGFVAEEIAGTSLDIFVAYQVMEDGTKRPDGVYYPELTSALLSAIKHQDATIKSLTARIEALEAK